MSRPSLLRFLQHWFLFLAMAVIAIACGGRSDEGLLPPDLDGGSLDSSQRGDATGDGAGGDDVSIGRDGPLLPDGVVVLPDGVVVLPDGARVDGIGPVDPGDGGRLPDGGTARTLIRITVDPAVASIGLATPQQLSVTGFYSDGSTPQDLTAQVIYSTSAPGVATVNTAGLVTGVAAGTAIISVVKQPEGLMAEAMITVTSATVVSIAVTPATATVGIGATVKFTATATMSDATTRDVTATVNWASTDGAIASISGMMSATPGVATGIAAGMTTIRASMPTGGVTGTAALTVTAARLVSIAITPPNPVLPIGVTFSFQAAGTYDDGVIRDVTNSVQWASSSGAVASIGPTGSGTTLAAGTTNITATLNQGGTPIVGTTTLTVTAARLVSIEVTPAMSTLIVGGPTQQLVATGRFDNNTTLVITASVAWTSSLTTTATVSNAPGSEGLVTAVAPGMATISATLNNITGTATVTVVAARLVSIAITPAAPSVPKGATIPLTATGTYDTGQMLDVTTLVTWATTSAAIATISNAAGSQGQATGVALGTTQVSATAPGGMPTASVTLTVTDAVPRAIEVTPANASIQVTRTQQMTATAIYTDGTTLVVTTQVAWTTGQAAIATVSNGAGTQGTVTAVTVGTTAVRATWAAWNLVGTTNITVTPAIPTSITVSPATATINTNATQAFTAVVIYDIGTQATVTGQCMWTSSNTAVATMGTGMGAATATGRGGGMTTITCTYTAAGVTLTGTATLTINPPTLPVSCNVTPDPVTVTTGGTVPLTATVTYDNMMTANVTNTSTWVVSADAASIASVSTTGMMRGVVTGLSPGSATIEASFVASGVTVRCTAVVTVEGTPTGLTLSPGVASPNVGQTQNYTVTVLYSDGNSRVIPANNAQTICTSSDTGIATFQVMGMNRTANCLTEGMVTLTCTYTPGAPPGVTGTAQLDCQSPIPTRVDIVPGMSTVALGVVVAYTATATYADGSMANVTANALTTWSDSSNGTIVSVNNSGAQKGQANTLAQGTVTITANFRGVIGTATLTVGPVAPTGLSITPTGGMLPVGSTTQYTALLLWSNGTTTDVTQTATWTSSTPGGDAGPAVATVSTTGTRGVVTAVSPGSAQIRASYTMGTTFNDSVNVTVQ